MNVIVTGNIGSGKSTAIRRILAMLDEPVYGFWTEKRPPEADGSAPVYLHCCRSPLQFGESCRIGICRDRHAEANPAVFESLGVACLTGIPRGSLILMDEIGVMENRAPQFQAAIFALLDGDYRVIAAVRDKSTPLLDRIRAHPRSVCICVQETREPECLRRAARLLAAE